VIIHASWMHIYKRNGAIVAPPDLVVEILSPSSLRRDKIDKRHSYAKFGV
jgi:Uma2 family endonuclease